MQDAGRPSLILTFPHHSTHYPPHHPAHRSRRVVLLVTMVVAAGECDGSAGNSGRSRDTASLQAPSCFPAFPYEPYNIQVAAHGLPPHHT